MGNPDACGYTRGFGPVRMSGRATRQKGSKRMTAMHGLTGAGVLISLAWPVLVPGGYAWGPLILACLGLIAAPRWLWPGAVYHRLGRRGCGLMLVVLGVAATWLAMAGLHGEVASLRVVVASMLLALPALLALHAWRPPLAVLWAGLSVAATLSGAWALWQRLQLGAVRADGHDPLHAILFGNLSLLAGGLCMAGVAWSLGRPRQRFWRGALLLGALGGIAASVLSGTRGGWLALPLILLLFQRGFVAWLPGRQQLAIWLGGILLLGALYAVPHTGVQHRVALAADEVTHYLAGEPAATNSVITRLEMWRGTWRLIAERPLLGHGNAGYQEGMARLVEAGQVNASVLPHTHAHNDWLNTWVKLGLPGVLALVALYLLPLWLFRSGLRHPDIAHRSLAVAGLLLPVAFLDFGLTYSFFAYSVGAGLYCGWLVILWTFYRHTPIATLPRGSAEGDAR